MTNTEQTKLVDGIISDSIFDVKEGFKTRLEALNYVRGFLLAAVILGYMADKERRQIINDFKSKLDEINKEGDKNGI